MIIFANEKQKTTHMLLYFITSLPMMVSLFWLTVLIVDCLKQFTMSRARITIFAAVTTTLYGCHFCYFNHLTEWLPVSDTIYSAATLAVFPLYYLYIKETCQGSPTMREKILSVLPSTAIGTAVTIIYILMNANERQTFINNGLYGGEVLSLTGLPQLQAIIHAAGRLLFVMEILPVLYFGARLIRKYNTLVDNVYADSDYRRMDVADTAMKVFIATCVVGFICNIIGRYQFASNIALLAVPSVMFSILIFLVMYAAHTQRNTIVELKNETSAHTCTKVSETNTKLPPTQDDTQTEREEVKPDAINTLRQRIEQMMHEERPYLKPDLKISDIAMRLGTNRDYIYQAINVQMGISFADYVNRLRIDHACSLLRKNPTMPLSEVMVACGYSSNSTFYRCFRKFAGKTPAEYILANKNS